MSLRLARHIPRRYNRPTSRRTRALVAHRRANRWQLKKEKMRRMARRIKRLYIDWQSFVMRWFLVGLLVTLVFIFVVLLFSPIVQIRAIRVKRTDARLDVEKVQMALAPLFGRHTAFLSQIEVLSLLRAAIPDLDTVSISKNYPSELSVTVVLDPLVAHLAIVSPDEAQQAATGTGATMDYLTNEGMYMLSQEEKNDLPLIRIVDWGARPEPGDTILSQEFLERMKETEQELLSQFELVVTQRTVYLRGQEYHLSVEHAGENGVAHSVLWFDVRSPVEEQIGRYRTFLKAVGLDAAKEYIDLRLKDRIVYK